jgi:hypothetical protein
MKFTYLSYPIRELETIRKDEPEPSSLFECTVCGKHRRFVAWCDKDPFPLKCFSCNTITLHKRVIKEDIK